MCFPARLTCLERGHRNLETATWLVSDGPTITGFTLYVKGYFITNANQTQGSGFPRLEDSAEKYSAFWQNSFWL